MGAETGLVRSSLPLRKKFKVPSKIKKFKRTTVPRESIGKEVTERNNEEIECIVISSDEEDEVMGPSGESPRNVNDDENGELPSDTFPDELPTFRTQFERLSWLQEQRNVGLYVQCDACDKYRYLNDIRDPLELPALWYCRMNPDVNYNRCDVPEPEVRDSEERYMIYNEYHAGSIVWAKVKGYPWWPAMVDDDPNVEQYYWLPEDGGDVPTCYHVVFFDVKEVTRTWVNRTEIHRYKGHETDSAFYAGFHFDHCLKHLNFAKREASVALQMSVAERLKTYSFISRWPHPINEPNDEQKDSDG